MSKARDPFGFSDATDFVKVARATLTGESSIGGALPSDVDPAQGAPRVFVALSDAGSPYAARFSEGLSASLTDRSPEVRHYALIFFEQFPAATGAGRIADIVESADRALFAGTFVHGYELEFSLLRALGARVRHGDTRALGLARIEALKPGKAEGVAAALAAHDADWVLDHVEAIVTGSPNALGTLARQLSRAGRDIVEVCLRLARAPGVDPMAMRSLVERRIQDDGDRDRVLEALAARARA